MLGPMGQPSLLPTLLALGLAAGASMMLAPGCGGDTKQTTDGSAGTGAASGSGGGTTSSAGGSGGSGTTTTSTTNVQCTQLCDHLTEIKCGVLQNCEQDCNNHLNAPGDCIDEADALIACWVANLNEFQCTMMQVLPPPECKAQEKAFNDCINGAAPDASCLCSPGVGGGDKVTNCSRKTSCGKQDYTQNCQKLADGDPWTCSCLSNGALLGTCSEDANIDHCSFDFGCCVPLFCAASGE